MKRIVYIVVSVVLIGSLLVFYLPNAVCLPAQKPPFGFAKVSFTPMPINDVSYGG